MRVCGLSTSNTRPPKKFLLASSRREDGMASQKITRMIQHSKAHVRQAFDDVADTAPCFITMERGPKRVGSERCAILEVLFDAHLVQSATRALHHLSTQAVTRDKPKQQFRVLEFTLTRARANLATSQQVLRHSLVTRLGDHVEKRPKTAPVWQPAVRTLASVLPFRKSR